MSYIGMPLTKVIDLIDTGEIKKIKDDILILMDGNSYKNYISLSQKEKNEIKEKINKNKKHFDKFGLILCLSEITDFKINQLDMGILNEYTSVNILSNFFLSGYNYIGLREFENNYKKMLDTAEIIKNQADQMILKLEQKGKFKSYKPSNDVFYASAVLTHIIKRMEYSEWYGDYRDSYLNYIYDIKNIKPDFEKKMESLFSLDFYKYGLGVCKEFCVVFKYFMDIFGIESQRMGGTFKNTLSHSWIKVNLDGKWYILDLTAIEISDKQKFKEEELFKLRKLLDNLNNIVTENSADSYNIGIFDEFFYGWVYEEDRKYFSDDYINDFKNKYEKYSEKEANENYPHQKLIKEFILELYPVIVLDNEISDRKFLRKRLDKKQEMLYSKEELDKKYKKELEKHKKKKAKTSNKNKK